MILKDLWIVSKAGICLYHYQIMPSDYDEYENLFSGFISAFTSFTATITNKPIDFIKIGPEELHFVVLNDITLVSTILAPNEEMNVNERAIIRQLLKSIGERFIEKYAKIVKKGYFRSDLINNDFNQDIMEISTNGLKIFQDVSAMNILSDPRLLHLTICDQNDFSQATTIVGNEVTFEETLDLLQNLNADMLLVDYKFYNKLSVVSLPNSQVNVVAIWDDSNRFEGNSFTQESFLQFIQEINRAVSFFLKYFPIKSRLEREVLIEENIRIEESL